jgi:hypothetical protein
MATITRVGFGQVEPNHLSAQRTAQIYAQLPAASDIKVLENGQFVKYDYAKRECNFSGAGEWMMVFNEVKLYDDFWRESYKDFAMIDDNYTPGTYTNAQGEEVGVSHYGVGPFPGKMVPRVIKTNVGDIYTTNCLTAANTNGKAVVEWDLTTEDLEDLANKPVYVAPNAKGFLAKAANAEGDFVWQVVKFYTMADGQPAVKLMRVK